VFSTNQRDSRIQTKGVLSWLVRWACFCSSMAALVGPVQIIFFSHCYMYIIFIPLSPFREIREWWLLLTVETEENGDTKSSNERGPSSVGFGVSVVPVKETSVLPWLFWSAQYKIFYTISIYVSPSPSNLGWQACRAVCL
jgi:hypothetical protein